VYLPSAAALATTTQQDGAAGAGAAAAGDDGDSGWGSLAGYESQKQALEDYLLLPLKHPEVRLGLDGSAWHYVHHHCGDWLGVRLPAAAPEAP
jgi:hypothetical protein